MNRRQRLNDAHPDCHLSCVGARVGFGQEQTQTGIDAMVDIAANRTIANDIALKR
jgi:hypothetical protein